MNALPKRGLVLLTAGMLALTACGGGGGSTEPAATAEPAAEVVYEVGVLPADIHPGSLNAEGDELLISDTSHTSDFWYPEGDTSSHEYIELTQTDASKSNCALMLTWHKDNEKEGGSGGELFHDGGMQQTEDGHMVAANGEDKYVFLDDTEREFDFVFLDDFTMVNTKDGVKWLRSHPEAGCQPISWYVDALTSNIYTTGADDTIVLNPDGTFIETYKGEDLPGTWQVKAANVVVLVFDDPADATDSSNKWPIDFRINADGVVTAFDEYPHYEGEGQIGEEYTLMSNYDVVPKADAEAAAAATAAIAAAGSPYEFQGDLRDISYVNLDQEPDFVFMAWNDYDTWRDFTSKLNTDKLNGYIVQVEGSLHYVGQGSSLYYGHDEGEEDHNSYTAWMITDVSNNETLPADGTRVVATGVVFGTENQGNWFCTDTAHIVPVE